MLANIYYFVGLLILLTSVINTLNFLKFINIKRWSESFKKHTGELPSMNDFKNQENYAIFIVTPLFSFFQLIWFLLGLISNEWYVFLTIIIAIFIQSYILKKINYFFIEKYLGLLFSIFRLSLILFLIINHFHLNYDIYELLKSVFNI